MNLLIDTHVLLWWLDDPIRISDTAQSAIRNSENSLYVSAATVWEIVIKKALGKLDAPDNLAEVLRVCQFDSLPITAEHALAVRDLPLHHLDPFDRILIAQTKVEGLTIVTRDSNISRYPVSYMMAYCRTWKIHSILRTLRTPCLVLSPTYCGDTRTRPPYSGRNFQSA